MPPGRFATAINCMDGRVQLPVIAYLKERCGVDYVDMITEPGPIKLLAERTYLTRIDSVRGLVDVSINKHGSRHIAIAGHHDCAGNPVDKDTQLKQIAASIKLIKSWGHAAEVIGLWVDENGMVEEFE
ncbi:MAG TPA: carbonic anhydrase [bacterium]|nr:carbonic anhydrase [bacterium]